MADAYPWYGVVSGAQLEQRDLLYGCPCYRFVSAGVFEEETLNGIIVSHSCDLATGKLETVQLCPFWSLDEMAEEVEYFRSSRGREDLRRGNLPGYHLLNRSSVTGMESDYLVVDFRHLFSVHLVTLKDLAQGKPARLRLLPPYREHLAQAFARFFMRVGLPVDVPPFR